MKLILATTNQGKLAEVRDSLGNSGIEMFSLADFPDIAEIIEDGATFTENALIKAREVCSITGFASLADDSGLVVDALDGAPGVLSARFAPTTEERNARLLGMLSDIPDDKRTARFVCSFALVRPDGFEWTATGTCEGLIAREPSGAEGFGYDPVFFYPPLGKTFADIPRSEKNSISHRGQALELFKKAALNDNILI